MLIIIQKKVGTNQWDYPENPRYFPNSFSNPDNKQELVVENNSGKTLIELSANVPYTVVEYVGAKPAVEGVLAEGRVFGSLLPDAVALELEEIKSDVVKPTPLRRAANRVIWDIQSNYLFDPYAQKFINLMSGLVNNTSLTEEEAAEIIATLQT